MAEITLQKIEDLQAILELLPGLLTIASNGAGTTGKITLSQLKDWILNNPNLINATATTPNTSSNGTAIATTEFVNTKLAGLGLNQATASNFGTIRTDITDPVPIVYLKSQIDGFNSGARSIVAGGTGATTAPAARTNLGAAVNGSNGDITALTGLVSVPALIQAAIDAAIPKGCVSQFGGTTLPNGWLECNGQAVSRSVYAALFASIGTQHGSGDGSTTFNVPNFTDRTAVGVSGTKVLGTTGGSAIKVLSIAEIPAHDHGGATNNMDRSLDHFHNASMGVAGGHGHNTDTFLATNTATSGGGTSRLITGGTGAISIFPTGDHTHTLSVTGADRALDHLHSINSQGGSNSFSIQNPYLAIRYIIKF